MLLPPCCHFSFLPASPPHTPCPAPAPAPALPLAAPQSVTISGNNQSGYTYTITFDPVKSPGNQPLLRITGEQVTGTNLVFNVAKVLGWGWAGHRTTPPLP